MRVKQTQFQAVDQSMELYPFILVLYDAMAERAFWLDIQELLKQSLDLDQVTETVRIPIGNELSSLSIQFFRQKSLSAIKQMGTQDDDGQSKPR